MPICLATRVARNAVMVSGFIGVLALPSLAQAQAKNCGDPPDVLIVVDHSASMIATVAGNSRWEHAKAAVNGFVSKLDGEIRFGLMLFALYPNKGMCDPGQVNVPVGDLSQGPIASTLKACTATGLTPMGDSLRGAVAYLKSVDPKKKKYIVLVTDGAETCSGNPIAEVKAATAAGITTFVVGFGGDVDAKTLGQMATDGGTAVPGPKGYYQADDPTQLNAALSAIGDKVSCCGNGVFDPGEKCEKSLPPGAAGACPTVASCKDNDPCTTDGVSGTECSVVCTHSPVLLPKGGDGCCPPLANSTTDSDCPASCGNGILETGEDCDPRITSAKGKCKTVAECNDNDPCTKDALAGDACHVTCSHSPIPAAIDKTKDGCCPKGLTVEDDPDCLPICDPDSTEGCVDLCKGVTCPKGTFCFRGTCKQPAASFDASASVDDDGGSVPVAGDGKVKTPGQGGDAAGKGPGTPPGENFYDGDKGCACRIEGASSNAPAVPIAWAILAAALVLVGRRRRRR